MASLRQEQRYGLSSRGRSRSSANSTLYHVKLTDTALRALEAHRNLKGSLPSQPSIRFKGSQGYIKIPAPTPEQPSALRVFSFYVSSDSRDQPQASFDCVHQYVSSSGREQLEGQGVIQDKITVCATDDSYQVTRERMSQVEKDSWSRSAIEIKPGDTHPNKCVKFHKRPAPPTAPDIQKQCTLSRRNGTLALPTQRPLRERIIHLLALKPFSKPELLLWMERDRASSKDKAELGGILEEVAKVHPKDSRYLLRDDFYKYVQKDWPGYSDSERQQISRMLARKLLPSVSQPSRNPQPNASTPKASNDATQTHNPLKNPTAKRPVPLDSVESVAAKRQRLADQRLHEQPASNGLNHTAVHAHHPSYHSKTDFQRTSGHTANQNGSPGGPAGFPLMHRPSECREHETKESSRQPRQGDCDLQLALSQHRKKKSKKHKDKERERSKDKRASEWSQTSPELKHKQHKLDDPDFTNEMEEKPDYVLTHSAIVTLEQRQRYQRDFSAEYDEYKDLHSRIATITHMFVQLESKIKSLSRGTPEYKIMEDQILEKYNKYREKFPGYREEKKRCEYLHQKLSYIKQLISDFDVSQASS
ncbi:RNA polymerase II elongation factor ELL2-like [Nelusetta ayraudi]|uniref:RNA polymerase II elongation factor ELL2-like n=1 Tax=Nelusetta ayraudi TaxID=303726 RepID=UPI003F6E7D87